MFDRKPKIIKCELCGSEKETEPCSFCGRPDCFIGDILSKDEWDAYYGMCLAREDNKISQRVFRRFIIRFKEVTKQRENEWLQKTIKKYNG